MTEDYRYKKRQHIAMTLEDTLAFEEAIFKKFPDFRIVRQPLEDKWLETWKWGVISRVHFEHSRKVWQKWKWPCVMRDPTGDSLVYRDSLAYPWDESFLVWLEPEGWVPEWEYNPRWRQYNFTNKPRFWFEYRRSYYTYVQNFPGSYQQHDPDWWIRHETWRPPKIPDDDIIITMSEGSIGSSWKSGDKACEAFARKVFRIADKFMTNTFRFVDRDTLMPYQREPTRTTIYWAGHHAMKWAAERRHNYIFGFLKPPDYDFGPDEPPA